MTTQDSKGRAVTARFCAPVLRLLSSAILAAAVMLAAGTVTGSHGHRTTVPRFHFPLQNVTELHADIGWFVGAPAISLAIGLHFTQYFSHRPGGLVWVHDSMSAVLWILVLRLYLSTSEHGPLPSAGARACQESAARNLQAPRVTLGAEEGVS